MQATLAARGRRPVTSSGILGRVKCVHRTSDRSIAQLLRSALQSEGIEAVVDGEHLSSLQGLAVPAGPSAEYRVCIVDPDQTPRASLLVAGWLENQKSGTETERWSCGECGETHEGQFSSCWKCGAERGAA